MEEFFAASPPKIFWNSRKRSASGRSSENASKDENLTLTTDETKESTMEDAQVEQPKEDTKTTLSERRKALFEPLEPNRGISHHTRAEDLLPPPDFDTVSYPKGWLVGKRRKLVNVDVVESMRRIAVQEMNRKDREIDGLNEQLEEDSRCLEHLQLQLVQEKSKRAEVERENTLLQDQISMLMNMLEDTQGAEEEDYAQEDS